MGHFLRTLSLSALFVTTHANGAGVQSINLFGGAVAGYNVTNENVPWSLMLGGGFEYGTKRAALYADIHSLPLFETRFGPNNRQCTMVMGTCMTTGNRLLRVGPYITAGYTGFSLELDSLLPPKVVQT